MRTLAQSLLPYVGGASAVMQPVLVCEGLAWYLEATMSCSFLARWAFCDALLSAPCPVLPEVSIAGSLPLGC